MQIQKMALAPLCLTPLLAAVQIDKPNIILIVAFIEAQILYVFLRGKMQGYP